jgi:hypothetical protein
VSKLEAEIKAEIRVELSKAGVVVWDQSCGTAVGSGGTMISYGLCRGSSDLIGIRKCDGRFVAIEVKSADGMRKHRLAMARCSGKKCCLTISERHAFEQQKFLELVHASGGLSGFASSVEDAIGIVT